MIPLRIAPKGLLLLLLGAYTIYAIGPFLWLAAMSLRTTVEINLDHYAFPRTFHWWRYGAVWIDSNYSGYFRNSIIVVTASVLFLTWLPWPATAWRATGFQETG